MIIYGGALLFGIGLEMKIRSYYNSNQQENGINNQSFNNKNNVKEEPFYFSDDELKNLPDDIRSLLTCSIKQGIFHYPVISPYGFTNEQETIDRWLQEKSSCPLTKKPLYHNELILNRNVFNLIKCLVLKERYNKSNSNTILDSEILD